MRASNLRVRAVVGPSRFAPARRGPLGHSAIVRDAVFPSAEIEHYILAVLVSCFACARNTIVLVYS